MPVKTLADSVLEQLSSDSYSVTQISSSSELINFLTEHKEEIDCLIVLKQNTSLPIFNQLYEQGILLPTVLIDLAKSENGLDAEPTPNYFYHSAEIEISSAEVANLSTKIPQAINQFLHLGQSCSLEKETQVATDVNKLLEKQVFYSYNNID